MTDLFQNDDQPVIDENKKYYDILTGPGGKFHDPDPEVAKEKIARGKYEADLMIETMKRRQDQMRDDFLRLREEHMASASLNEAADRLAQSRQPQTNSELPNAMDVKMPDPKEIEGLVESKLQAAMQRQKEDANFNQVMGKVKEKLGPNYANVLKEQTANLGLSPDEANSLARKSPEAFYRMYGLNEQRQDLFQAPPGSAIRADQSLAPKKRTWSYYQDLKAKDPKAYLNPKTQVQMHNDYLALGKDFEDGDFNRSWSV